MTRILRSAILSAAVAATTLTAIPAANAGDRWNHYNYYRHSSGDVVAAGVLGLAAGAIIAGIASQPRYSEPAYVDSYRYQRVRPGGYYYANGDYDGPYARGSLQPWSREWYRYCRNRYRTFDPGSGTFIGY